MAENSEINQRQWFRQKHYFLKAIDRQIRRSLPLRQIIKTAVKGTQALLHSDRLFIYNLIDEPSESIVITELVERSGDRERLHQDVIKYLRQLSQTLTKSEKPRIITGIDRINSNESIRESWQKLAVKSQLGIPVTCYQDVAGSARDKKYQKYLWGWLVAQECQTSRNWQPQEVDLMEEVAGKLAIAIEQSAAKPGGQISSAPHNNWLEKNARLQQQLIESQQVELDLCETAIGFARIIEIAEDAIICFDKSQQIVLFNQGAEKIFGYRPEEAIGQSLDLLLPSRFVSIHCQHVQKFQNSPEIARKMGDRRSSIFARRQDGSEFPAEASISKLKLNNQTVFTVILRDVTAQKQVETALRESEAQLQRILRGSKDGVWDWDIQKNTVFFSDRWKEMRGYAPHEISNSLDEWQRGVHPDDIKPLMNAVQKHFQDKTSVFTAEYRVQKKDGIYIWILDRGQAIWDEAGNPIRMAGMETDITAQKQIEQNLREIEARFQAFMNYAPLLSWMVDLDGKVIYANQLFLELFNHHQPLQDSTTIRDIFSPKMARQYMQNNRIVAITGEVLQTIESALNPDGSIKNYFVCKFPIIHGGGGIWIGGIAIDITEQQKAEAALRESEAKFRQLAENIHQAFFITSIDEELLYISPGYEKIWGKSCQSIYEDPRSWMSSIHPEDFPQVMAAFQNQMETGTSFDETYRIFRPNGELRWVRSRSFPLRDETGQTIRFTGLAEDITAAKRAQEKIESQYQQALLLRQITDAIRENLSTEHIFETTALQIGKVFGVDRCLIHRYVTEPSPQIPAVAEYLNGDYSSLKNIEIPIAANPHVKKVLEQDRALATADVFSEPLFSPVIHLCEQLQIQSMLVVRTSYQQQPNGVISLQQCDKIREWNAAEIELLEAVAAQVGIALAQATLLEQEIQQRQELTRKNEELETAKQAAESANRAKSEFLATMSHEIRTPMNAVLGFTDLLQSIVTDPKAKSYIEAIASSGNTLLSLINDILDLSKIEAGKLEINLEPVNLREMVQEIEQIFQHKADRQGLKLTAQIDPTIPTVILLDEVRIRQTLFNLVGNAIKFTEFGTVEIILNCHESNPTAPEKIGLEIIVKDTGIGIAPEHQQKIFAAFTQSDSKTTRKYGGTGLGLAITQRLIELLGGTIYLQSKLGEGSTFTIYLPSVEICGVGNACSPELLEDTNLQQFAPMTILVVDDVPSNLDLIAGYFSETHHQLIFAEDGDRAINLAVKHHPDLILLDLRMPRMDGCQAAQLLKQEKQLQAIPIVVVTASCQQQDEVQMKQLCEGFVLKPVSQAELVAEMKTIFPVNSNHRETHHPDKYESTPLTEPIFTETIDLPQLLVKLDRLEKTDWPELSKTLKMREIEAFANHLTTLATEHQCQQLLDYARTLQTQLDDFDWDLIPDTVDRFSTLIKSL